MSYAGDDVGLVVAGLGHWAAENIDSKPGSGLVTGTAPLLGLAVGQALGDPVAAEAEQVWGNSVADKNTNPALSYATP